MKKLMFVFLMFACIGEVSVAEAACFVPCPNVVGAWKFTDAKTVSWNGGTGQYTYESGISGTISIDSQQECLFYGTFQPDGGENPVPITGTVYQTSVRATDADQDIIDGTLFQCNITTNRYTKLRFRINEVLDISLTPSGSLTAGIGIATRQ